MAQPDVSVVVVTWNALPWLEQCLDSVRGHDTIVVDHGSTDGTVAFVRERYPDVRVIEQENKGMGGGNNAGMRRARGRYFLLLNSDAWVLDDGVDRLVEFADGHPEAAVVGPKLLNPDGTLQRSARGEPTVWRLATEYFFIRKLAPRTRLLNPLYRGDFDHTETAEVDWLYGPALLVRREAADAVGLFDEDFFMFSEEVDWLTRFRRAGWKVVFFPGAEVVHVG
ncbi:MAG TPA: glycosyltransferase family 2 protein, partial [Gaiellaceae bacterium]